MQSWLSLIFYLLPFSPQATDGPSAWSCDPEQFLHPLSHCLIYTFFCSSNSNTPSPFPALRGCHCSLLHQEENVMGITHSIASHNKSTNLHESVSTYSSDGSGQTTLLLSKVNPSAAGLFICPLDNQELLKFLTFTPS